MENYKLKHCCRNFTLVSLNKPKMAYSRDLAVMNCHGWLSWMTFMSYFFLPPSISSYFLLVWFGLVWEGGFFITWTVMDSDIMDCHGWLTWLTFMDHKWLSWMTVNDDCHEWLSWMTVMDDFHGWLSWMTYMEDFHDYFYGFIQLYF